MATVTIHNLDPQLVAKLKTQAKANHRSLQAELHDILSRSVLVDVSRREFLAKADRIAAMTLRVPQTDSAKLLRRDRAR